MNYKIGIKLTLFLVIGAVTTLAWANTLPRSIEASTIDRGGVNCDCKVTFDITLPCPATTELPCNINMTFCSSNGLKTGMCKTAIAQPCPEEGDPGPLCEWMNSRTCKNADCLTNSNPDPGLGG